MKVLVITNLSLGNSATLPEKRLMQGLISKGVDITIMAQFPTSDQPDIELAGIRLLYQHITKKIDPASIRRIRKLIKEEKYDILHFMFSKAITNGLIAARGLNVKTIGYLGSLSCYWHDPFSWLSFLNPRLDKLICVSDGVRNHILKQLPTRFKNRIIRIYKGSDPDWFKEVVPVKRSSLGIPEDAFVVCCVANIRKTKGVKWLIESVNYLPENLPVWFLLVGDKSDSAAVGLSISKTKYADNFVTTGYSNEPNSYSAICDLYIQPSVCEGFPKTVVEAMCLGKPVVVTERGGAKELVKEGITGYVIPSGSPVSIADTILKCFEGRDSLPVMGEKGRERIRDEFNHCTTVEETYKLYRELTVKTQGPAS
jgi:glycosyltransferase involved in cell wall biosynthesis